MLGHWGSDAPQCFTYIHLNRLINKYDLNAVFISGPGHGAPGVLSQAYLEGTYAEVYPDKSEDEEGIQRFFKQFSFPGGMGGHATPETPGTIHEATGLRACPTPLARSSTARDLITLVMVGDGESEASSLATSWHSNKFLNPITDGAVLPVLHLNGYKINNPTVLARISHEELEALFIGYGYTPAYFVEGERPREHAPGHGRHPGTLRFGNPPVSRGGPADRPGLQATLARGHPSHPQGLDRAPGGGRALPGGLLAGPPDPHHRRGPPTRPT